MADFVSISSALTSIKTASDIVKMIRESDASLEKAEMKLQLAELMESLADTKMNLSTIQDELKGRDERIAELEVALELKGEIVRDNEVYYMTNDEGEPTGDPLCPNCIEVNSKYVHLVQNVRPRNQSRCPNCESMYNYKVPK
jgi:hypothetical protein|tara:strand:+ start:113 stop:538 length:426 start_codon:yes stop_codon:yes gene_type:complete